MPATDGSGAGGDGGDADASEALRQLNLVLLQGEVVGLMRQIERDESAPEIEEADETEHRMLALARQPVGLPRVASARLGVPDGGLESNLEAETTQATATLKSICRLQ